MGLIRTMAQRLAGTQVAGLPEVIEDIQQKKQQLQEKLFEHRMKPENAPLPYHPETNPQLPDYPGGRPTGTGGFAYNKSEVQHIAGLPQVGYMQIIKDATGARGFGDGSKMTSEQEDAIYNKKAPSQQYNSPKDRQYMDVMKSGFV